MVLAGLGEIPLCNSVASVVNAFGLGWRQAKILTTEITEKSRDDDSAL